MLSGRRSRGCLSKPQVIYYLWGLQNNNIRRSPALHYNRCPYLKGLCLLLVCCIWGCYLSSPHWTSETHSHSVVPSSSLGLPHGLRFIWSGTSRHDALACSL